MNEFFKTAEGKILSHGIHEHNSAVGLAKSNVLLAIDMLKMPNYYTIEEIIERLELTKKHFKKCLDSMDYLYEEIKKLKEENGKNKK